MKGWYGNKQAHSLASKGIRTKMNARGYTSDDPYYVDSIIKGDYKLTIIRDQDPESPRDWDNLGHMITWHSKYNLGDDQPDEDAEEWMEELKETYGEDVLILPLYLYDHSGITISTTPFGCRWDSGQVGWIYASHDEIKKEYGDSSPDTVAKVKKYLEGEVDVYDDYLRGNVYGFELEKREHCHSCEHDEWEHVESVWGFVGDFKNNENGMKDHMYDEGGKLFDELVKTSSRIY